MVERTLKRFDEIFSSLNLLFLVKGSGLTSKCSIPFEVFSVVVHGILMRTMCLDLSLVVFPWIVLLKVSEQIGFADDTDIVIGFIFCVEDEHSLNGCSNRH
jgi:hypothetical protein